MIITSYFMLSNLSRSPSHFELSISNSQSRKLKQFNP
eukprot:UN10295